MLPCTILTVLSLSLFLAAVGAPLPRETRGGAVEVAEGGALREGTFRYIDREIAYVARGTGTKAVVLVHGWGADRRSWGTLVESLEVHGQVAALDLIGHGRSEAPELEYTPQLLAGCVTALLDELGAEEAVLVGHSAGVPVCREVLRRGPERVRGLVVVDGALRDVLPPGMAEQMLERFRSPNYRDTIEQMRDFQRPKGELTQRQIDDVIASALSTPQHVLSSTSENQLVEGYWRADPIEVPLLAVYAHNPLWPMWTEEYLDFVRRIAPGADIRVWDDASHLLHLERATEFRGLLADFARTAFASPEAPDPGTEEDQDHGSE